MDVAVSLKPVEDLYLSAFDRPILNVLKATLHYPADTHNKGRKLADDIDFFNRVSKPGNELCDVWAVLLDIVCCIPPGHSWQESLLQCLDNLRQREGPVEGYYFPNAEVMRWKNLPSFSACVRDKWNTDLTAEGEGSSEELAKWKNLNSFVARFMTKQAVIWLHLPVWQFNDALEQPLSDSEDITECQLWVTSEWLIHCAGPIFKEMSSKPDVDESDAGSFKTGPLCDAEPMSVERWQFWRKRLSELAAGVSAGVAGHVEEALRSMDAAEADVTL